MGNRIKNRVGVYFIFYWIFHLFFNKTDEFSGNWVIRGDEKERVEKIFLNSRLGFQTDCNNKQKAIKSVSTENLHVDGGPGILTQNKCENQSTY